MKQHLKQSILIMLVGGIVVIGSYMFFYKLRLTPESVNTMPSKNSNSVVSKSEKSNIVVWGKVTDKDKKPLPGIVISAEGTGVKTENDGSYVLILTKSGAYPLSFTDAATGQYYQIVNDMEQTLFVSNGDNLNRDFVVEKIIPAQ